MKSAKGKNEQETRQNLIDEALKKAGWDKENILEEKRIGTEARRIAKKAQILKGKNFTDGRIILDDKVKRAEAKRYDYLLEFPLNNPLAIIEAKAEQYASGKGLQQAKEYAKLLNVKFAFSTNGTHFSYFNFIDGKTRDNLPLDKFPSPKELYEAYLNRYNLSDKLSLLTTSYAQSDSINTPRYYQKNAINRTIEAIARGKDRILLVMATGTGKTTTAFQIVYRLLQANAVKKVLYLADRNILIDQPKNNEFSFNGNFKDKVTKIKNKNFNDSSFNAYSVFFGIYQQFVSYNDNEEPIFNFNSIPKDFFDLIIVDECHRGSRKDDSTWKEILNYFKSAIHLGLTATPIHAEEGSNTEYFGDPIYTYSLKQGIEDGFLAPYKVVRYFLSVDVKGYTPKPDELDIFGNHVEYKLYPQKDFNKKIFIDQRTKLVAKTITEFLKTKLKDPYAKTIVFCKTQEHALAMSHALANENSDLMKENPNYVARITSDESDALMLINKFKEEKIDYKNDIFIATTSQLLRTGVDTKLVKLIVLDCEIGSMSEFKQIMGRGTRINTAKGKYYFTIMDFTGATDKFKDPAFDDDVIVINVGSVTEKADDESKADGFPVQKPEEKNKDRKLYVDGGVVTILGDVEQILDAHGNLISKDFKQYSAQNMQEEYQSLEHFLKEWHNQSKKTKLIDELENKGILIKDLRAKEEFKNYDEFDILISLAFNQSPLTRKARSQKAKALLQDYEGRAKEILEALLNEYDKNGITALEQPKTFDTLFGKNFSEVSAEFNTKSGGNLIQAINALKTKLYEVA